eukprot:c34256_g1_i1 orf=1178-2488(-)
MTVCVKMGLPTMQMGSVKKPFCTGYRTKQIGRAFNNFKISCLSGLVTFVVLRSTIGNGKFGSPIQDFNDIRVHLVSSGNHAHRILTESALLHENSEVTAGKPYTLSPKVLGWDSTRKTWLQKNPQFNNPADSRPQIFVVTASQPAACEGEFRDFFLVKFIKNKMDYCRLHGIKLFYNLAHWDDQMTGFWAKLPLIRKLMLSHPEAEWIWWMDSDALFTDMVFELPMDRYQEYNMVLHGWDELVYHKNSWIGLNTGSFLIRNCQWSLELLDAWAPMGPEGTVRQEAGKLLTRSLAGRPAFEADDQSALIYILSTQRSKWSSKVFLENSYYLHGYWEILVDKYEEMMEKYHPGLGDDRWPFVTHFVGCKPCGSAVADYAKCLKQMERAFNFADNQILQMYGFMHKRLDTAEVKHTRNHTARPLDITDELNLLHSPFIK